MLSSGYSAMKTQYLIFHMTSYYCLPVKLLDCPDLTTLDISWCYMHLPLSHFLSPNRFCRLRNYNTLYICGTDEYGAATETKVCHSLQLQCEGANKHIIGASLIILSCLSIHSPLGCITCMLLVCLSLNSDIV